MFVTINDSQYNVLEFTAYRVLGTKEHPIGVEVHFVGGMKLIKDFDTEAEREEFISLLGSTYVELSNIFYNAMYFTAYYTEDVVLDSTSYNVVAHYNGPTKLVFKFEAEAARNEFVEKLDAMSLGGMTQKDTFADFPQTGSPSGIYLAKDTGQMYFWDEVLKTYEKLGVSRKGGVYSYNNVINNTIGHISIINKSDLTELVKPSVAFMDGSEVIGNNSVRGVITKSDAETVTVRTITDLVIDSFVQVENESELPEHGAENVIYFLKDTKTMKIFNGVEYEDTNTSYVDGHKIFVMPREGYKAYWDANVFPYIEKHGPEGVIIIFPYDTYKSSLFMYRTQSESNNYKEYRFYSLTPVNIAFGKEISGGTSFLYGQQEILEILTYINTGLLYSARIVHYQTSPQSRFLDCTVNYQTVYEPKYPGSPATKQYVDFQVIKLNGDTESTLSADVTKQIFPRLDEEDLTKNPVIIYSTVDSPKFTPGAYVIEDIRETRFSLRNLTINVNNSHGDSYDTARKLVTRIVVDHNADRTSVVGYPRSESSVHVISSYLVPNHEYETPYEPLYDGSPATKKYVNDSISNQINYIGDHRVLVIDDLSTLTLDYFNNVMLPEAKVCGWEKVIIIISHSIAQNAMGLFTFKKIETETSESGTVTETIIFETIHQNAFRLHEATYTDGAMSIRPTVTQLVLTLSDDSFAGATFEYDEVVSEVEFKVLPMQEDAKNATKIFTPQYEAEPSSKKYSDLTSKYRLSSTVKYWREGMFLNVGDICIYEDEFYECIASLASASDSTRFTIPPRNPKLMKITDTAHLENASKKYVDDNINALTENIYEIELDTTFRMTNPGYSSLLSNTDKEKFNSWLEWLSQKEGETELHLYTRFVQSGTDSHSYGVNNERRLVKVLRISYADLLNNTHQYISFTLWEGSSQSSFGKTYQKYQVTISLRFDTTVTPAIIKGNFYDYDCCRVAIGDRDYMNYLTDQRINSKIFEGDEDEYNLLTNEQKQELLIAIVNPLIEENEIDLNTVEQILLDENPTETELDLTDEEVEEAVDSIIGGV